MKRIVQQFLTLRKKCKRKHSLRVKLRSKNRPQQTKMRNKRDLPIIKLYFANGMNKVANAITRIVTMLMDKKNQFSDDHTTKITKVKETMKARMQMRNTTTRKSTIKNRKKSTMKMHTLLLHIRSSIGLNIRSTKLKCAEILNSKESAIMTIVRLLIHLAN